MHYRVKNEGRRRKLWWDNTHQFYQEAFKADTLYFFKKRRVKDSGIMFQITLMKEDVYYMKESIYYEVRIFYRKYHATRWILYKSKSDALRAVKEAMNG